MSVEVDVLPESWEVSTLGEVAEINPSSSTVVAEDGQAVTFLPMAAVEEISGNVDISGQRAFGEVKKGFTRFRDGDLLFAKITPCMENGKTAVVRGLQGGIGCGSTEFHVLRSATDVHPDYLRYFVVRSAFRQVARRNMQGAVGQQRVPVSFLRESLIPIAPSPEQQRIVSKIDELFSRIDEGERALERVQKLVERYRQSVLKAAVTGELTREWREKQAKSGASIETGEALLARILTARREAWEQAELDKMKAKGIKPKDDKSKQKYIEPVSPDTTDLPELPEGWVWASMDQLSWASSYGTSEKCAYENTGPSVLRIPNIRSGCYVFEDVKHATSDLNLETADLVKKGDLLVVRTNGSDRIIGIGAVSLNEPPFSCYFASYLIRFRISMPGELSSWVNYCWQSQVVRSFVNKNKATSAGQYNISQSKLMGLCLPIPPASERQAIVDEVDSQISKARAVADEIENQIKSAFALRQAVLKSGFRGELVPQDPNDEPALALLKRIAAERAAAPAKPKRSPKLKMKSSK